jgi:hypothetical protein
VLVPLLVSLGVACGGGSPGAAASPSLQDTVSIQTRLVSGSWRLVEYRPDVALEPMLNLLLLQQVRTMVVHFDGRMLSAQSPSIQFARPYTIENAAGLGFDLVSPDVQGAGPVRSHCQMSDDGRRIAFRAQSDPWTGTGIIEREGP